MTHSRPSRPRQSRSSYNGRFSSNDTDRAMNKDTPEARATERVGDGKTPNEYFVTVSDTLYKQKGDTQDYVKKKTHAKTISVHGNYDSAVNRAEQEFGGTFKEKKTRYPVTNVTVEDRLSGQVFEKSVGFGTHRDIGFTKSTEAKRRVKPTTGDDND